MRRSGPGPGARGVAMSRRPGPAGPRRSPGAQPTLVPAGLDLDAEREKIRREIEELERSLEPGATSVEVTVSDSSLSSGTGRPLLSSLPRCFCVVTVLPLHTRVWFSC